MATRSVVTARASIRAGLERVRTNRRDHVLALAVVLIVGLVLAWIHWLGLVVAGVLVGVIARTPLRAVVGGLGFGLIVLVVFTVSLGSDAWTVLRMTPVTYLVVAAALGLPALGSLVRLAV